MNLGPEEKVMPHFLKTFFLNPNVLPGKLPNAKDDKKFVSKDTSKIPNRSNWQIIDGASAWKKKAFLKFKSR